MTISTWVVGSGGLLGSAIVRRLVSRPDTVLIDQRVRWGDVEQSLEDLRVGIRNWLSTEGANRFELVWAAGAAVTSTTRTELDAELDVLRWFIALVAESLASCGLADATSMFLASSAGGVYAGARGAPFTELTEARAASPYGETKLAMESLVTDFARTAGVRVLVGRISNLYGPGQRIEKPQGFVSQLCKSMLSRKPMAVYVSLDTMRDYIFADDAAETVVRCLARLADSEYAGNVLVKNIASHVPTTLGHILHEARLVFKRRPDVILAWSSMAAGQVRDLRIDSVTWPDLNDLPRRTLIVGLAETKASMELQMHRIGFGQS